jgi:ectoine hydroxylase-related dioxygenase (phytanoyl-CoA dioxygenase family)
MNLELSDPKVQGVRQVTPNEVRFYREHGWAKLENIIPLSLTEKLLALAKDHMGENAGNPEFNSRGARYAAWVNGSSENEWLRSISQSRELGSIASTLVGDRKMRWYTDIFMAKLSVGSGGARTPWHQDLPHQAFDRGGALSLWVPLVDCPPEKGSMRFLSRSKTAGPLGRFGMRADGLDIVDYYPQVLNEFEMSPPIHLRIGDATVHDFLTVHSAPDNLTDSTRWVYAVTWFPAETLYNGARSLHTSGLEVDKEFDDKRFPVVNA